MTSLVPLMLISIALSVAGIVALVAMVRADWERAEWDAELQRMDRRMRERR